jgi:hypothetical protein
MRIFLEFWLFFCILVLTSNMQLLGQETSDSIKVPKSLLIESAKKLKNYQMLDSVQTLQITSLKTQITKFEQLSVQNNQILALKDQEILMYRSLSERFLKIPALDEKWYQSKTFNFISGVVVGAIVIYSGAYIVSTIR